MKTEKYSRDTEALRRLRAKERKKTLMVAAMHYANMVGETFNKLSMWEMVLKLQNSFLNLPWVF